MRIALAIALLALASCVAPPKPTPEQIQASYCGPKPERYAETVAAYFNATLKDPYTAHIEIGEPVKGWFGHGASIFDATSSSRFAWKVPTIVNAKNSYGAYTGAEGFRCYFSGEELIAVIPSYGEAP